MKPANCYLCGLPLRYGAVSHAIDGRTLFPMYHPAAALYRARFRTILIDDFNDGNDVSHDLYLIPSRQIEGRVVNPEGQPVPGATVKGTPC